MLLSRLRALSVEGGARPFAYSNFGYATLGYALETVYGVEYSTLMNRFVQEDLGLTRTQMADGSNAPPNGWAWMAGDAYLAAGGLISDIGDMLAYARMQLENGALFAACHEPLADIDATTERNAKLGIRMDEAASGWMLDRERGFLWHNGGTGHYNCYLGVHPASGAAVVILSNLAPNDRIPATVLGVKLLEELSE